MTGTIFILNHTMLKPLPQSSYNCPYPMPSKKSLALDSFLLAVFTAWMILPLFALKYSDRWISIESTFISDARFLANHWPHPRWQPLWYTGTRFDYIYPPMLRYGTAVLTRLFPIIPAKAYHIYCAVLYAIGITAVYLWVAVCARSRLAGWYASLGTLLLSPALLFIPRLWVRGWHGAPQRIVVLTQWGEGPHMSALALIPLALLCGFLAFERKRPAALAGAAFFSALVVSTNFYGATALAMFFPVLVWSFWITHQDKAVFLRAALIAILACGLCAFWLVPSYLRVTLQNLQYVSQPGTTWSLWIFVVVAIIYMLLSDRYARGRSERVWPVFVIGCVVFFLLNVVGNEHFQFRIAGEPTRLVPELDMVLTVGMLEVFRWLQRRPARAAQFAAIVLAAVTLLSAAPYVIRHRVFFPRDWEFQRRPEYQLPEWIYTHMPDARVLPAGSVRFWYDTWHDLPQLGGGSDQGINNGLVVAAQWQILLGDAANADLSIEWLRTTGVDAVIVNGPTSKELYHDFQFPKKFEGKLPVLYDNHEGDIIYGVPRRFPGIARVVEAAPLQTIKVFGRDPDVAALKAYAAVIEQGPNEPATVTWQGSDQFRVHGRVAKGQLLLVQESWDPSWQAWKAGRQIPVSVDPMGFMTVDPGEGEQEVTFVLAQPLENKIGRLITLLTLAILAALVYTAYRAATARERK